MPNPQALATMTRAEREVPLLTLQKPAVAASAGRRGAKSASGRPAHG